MGVSYLNPCNEWKKDELGESIIVMIIIFYMNRNSIPIDGFREK